MVDGAGGDCNIFGHQVSAATLEEGLIEKVY
jgi:hypothetical protein